MFIDSFQKVSELSLSSHLVIRVPEIPFPEIFNIGAKTANMGINFRPENSKLIPSSRSLD